VNQGGWSLNRLVNPQDPAANIYVLLFNILYRRIIKCDPESTRQFAQPGQELRAVEIYDKNAVP
jgi:hypothetical protein